MLISDDDNATTDEIKTCEYCKRRKGLYKVLSPGECFGMNMCMLCMIRHPTMHYKEVMVEDRLSLPEEGEEKQQQK